VRRSLRLVLVLMVTGLVASLAAVIPSFVATSAPAAAAAGCYAQDCNGKDPQAWGCDGDASTQWSSHYPGSYGSTVELRYSPSCGAFWARYSCDDCFPNCGQPIISLQNGKVKNGVIEVVQTLERGSSTTCYYWTGMLTAVNRWGRVRVGQIYSWPGGSDVTWKPWGGWKFGS